MEYITGITSSGGTWTPTFVVRSDINNCGCCGKCFKICGRGVFEYIDHPNSDDLCGAKVMTVAHPENCIGCGACARGCPKKNIVCEPKVRVI
jgi:Nif-specific ferredoxin III